MTVDEQYGALMNDALSRYSKTSIVTENLVKTIKWVRNELYEIDMNPRYATLKLYLQYNLPSIESHCCLIWDNLHKFISYESKIN